jgi:acetyl esterase/lipase
MNRARVPHPAIDAELATGLATMLDSFGDLTPDSVELARAQSDQLGNEQSLIASADHVVWRDITIAGPPGGPDLTMLVVQPKEAARPTPLIYHTHGGGYFAGNRFVGLQDFVPTVASGLATVVSVEYRLAPDHPDPAPIDDSYRGLVFCAENAEELGVDTSRIIVAGASAGGGLAAATVLMARDLGFPHITHQILMSPMLDDRGTTESSRAYRRNIPWDSVDNEFGWTCLLGERRGGKDVSPYAAPARAEDLSNLPRTYLDVGSVETFRDEVMEYGRRLAAAGVQVDLHVWGGGFHGFDFFVPTAELSVASFDTRQRFIVAAVSDQPARRRARGRPHCSSACG